LLKRESNDLKTFIYFIGYYWIKVIDLVDLTGLLTNFSFTEAYDVLLPLVLFIFGMIVYSIFIFRFYKFIARKNIFEIDFSKYNTATHPLLKKLVRYIFYVVEYVLLFPVFTFFWFIVFSVLLSFMAKSQVVGNVLLVSIALVSAVRVATYYDEDLSKDLAKMLPFALLGIFLIDITYFSFSESLKVIKQIPSMWKIMVYYLIFAICLEFVLRVAHGILKPVQDISK
jgi:hypothetical protein